MKEKFIKSSIILIIGGFITKVLGIVNKIMMTRLLKTEGLGLYMLILPTFSLFIRNHDRKGTVALTIKKS